MLNKIKFPKKKIQFDNNNNYNKFILWQQPTTFIKYTHVQQPNQHAYGHCKTMRVAYFLAHKQNLAKNKFRFKKGCKYVQRTHKKFAWPSESTKTLHFLVDLLQRRGEIGKWRNAKWTAKSVELKTVWWVLSNGPKSVCR